MAIKSDSFRRQPVLGYNRTSQKHVVGTEMPEESLEEIVGQLNAPYDWLVRGLAVRKLIPFGEDIVPHLSTVFALTFDAKAPTESLAGYTQAQEQTNYRSFLAQIDSITRRELKVPK